MREDMQKRKSMAAKKKGEVDVEIMGVQQQDLEKLASDSQENTPDEAYKLAVKNEQPRIQKHTDAVEVPSDPFKVQAQKFQRKGWGNAAAQPKVEPVVI